MVLEKLPKNDQKLGHRLKILIIDQNTSNVDGKELEDLTYFFKKVCDPEQKEYFNSFSFYEKFQISIILKNSVSFTEIFSKYSYESLLNEFAAFLNQNSDDQIFHQYINTYLLTNLIDNLVDYKKQISDLRKIVESNLPNCNLQSNQLKNIEQKINDVISFQNTNIKYPIPQNSEELFEKFKKQLNEQKDQIQQLIQEKQDLISQINEQKKLSEEKQESLISQINEQKKLSEEKQESLISQINEQKIMIKNLLHIIQPCSKLQLGSWKLLYGNGFHCFSDGSGMIMPDTCIVSDFLISIKEHKQMIFSFQTFPSYGIIFGFIYYSRMFKEIRKCDIIEYVQPLQIQKVEKDGYGYKITFIRNKLSEQNIENWKNWSFKQQCSLAFNNSDNIDVDTQIIIPNVFIMNIDEDQQIISISSNVFQTEQIKENMFVSIHSNDRSSFVPVAFGPYPDDENGILHGVLVENESNNMKIFSIPIQAKYCSVFLMNSSQNIMQNYLDNLEILNFDNYRIEAIHNEIPDYIMDQTEVNKLRETGKYRNSFFFTSATFQFLNKNVKRI